MGRAGLEKERIFGPPCQTRLTNEHILGLSRQPGRNPVKKPLRIAQAFLVAELVTHYLPQIKFSRTELRILPRAVARLTDELIDRAGVGAKSERPSGFEPPE